MFGFFKNKKAFEDAVQKEVEKREAERKQKAEESWEKWLQDNPVEIHFAEKERIKCLYPLAEEQYKTGKYDEALETLNSMITGFTDIGEIIGLYVFILLVDVLKALEGMSGAIEAYDMGINYYAELSGEYVDRWKEHLQVAKDSYIQEEKMIEDMKERYDFEIQREMIPALQRLESLAVNRFIKLEYSTQSGFDKVWFAVLREVDYFEQEDEWNSLNKTTYKGAKNWLKSFAHLCKDAVPEEYLPKEG